MLLCVPVSYTHLDVYKRQFLMSKEANVALWGMCMSFIFVTRSVLFFTAMLLSICVCCLTILSRYLAVCVQGHYGLSLIHI